MPVSGGSNRAAGAYSPGQQQLCLTRAAVGYYDAASPGTRAFNRKVESPQSAAMSGDNSRTSHNRRRKRHLSPRWHVFALPDVLTQAAVLRGLCQAWIKQEEELQEMDRFSSLRLAGYRHAPGLRRRQIQTLPTRSSFPELRRCRRKLASADRCRGKIFTNRRRSDSSVGRRRSTPVKPLSRKSGTHHKTGRGVGTSNRSSKVARPAFAGGGSVARRPIRVADFGDGQLLRAAAAAGSQADAAGGYFQRAQHETRRSRVKVIHI